jgi:hypothetical protein
MMTQPLYNDMRTLRQSTKSTHKLIILIKLIQLF